MKAMTILARCRNGEREIRRIKQRIAQRRDALTSITARVDDVGGGRSAGEPDRLGELVTAISELESDLQERERARLAEMSVACALLDTLGETESTVMYQYYVRNNNLRYIASRLRFSEGYIRTIKACASKTLMELTEAAVNDMLPSWYDV